MNVTGLHKRSHADAESTFN